MKNIRLQSVLQDMKDALGITAADLTPDELTALVHACERVDNPYHAIHADLVDRPVYVCPGVWFWPVTAGAQVWLAEYAAQWWPEGSVRYRWAQIYALMHARDPDAFRDLTTRDTARAAVLGTVLRLCCHFRELIDGINRAYGADPYEAEKPKRSREAERAETDFAAIVARLEVASGIRKEEWLWGRSIQSLMKSYVELTELSVAAFKGGKREANHELDEAIENLARVCAAIKRRVLDLRAPAPRSPAEMK